jgi:SAM-dependent methyltransferase
MTGNEWDWAGERADRWSAVADRLEAQIAPVDEVLFAAAALTVGEGVLDVGCGRGVATRRAAAAVGSGGHVTGLDISTRLVDEARERTPEGSPVDYVVGDAQVHPLDDLGARAVISRFGVMFFADPTAAFANLTRATGPGGRLCVAVWQPRARSSVMERPVEVACRVADALGVTLAIPPGDGGPYSLGDPDSATGVLEAAGWREVAVTPHLLPMYLGGPATPSEAADAALGLGTLHDALAEVPAELAAEVRRAVTDDLASCHDGTGARLEGAIALLTGRT